MGASPSLPGNIYIFQVPLIDRTGVKSKIRSKTMAELRKAKGLEREKSFKLAHSIVDKTKNSTAGVQVWKNGPTRTFAVEGRESFKLSNRGSPRYQKRKRFWTNANTFASTRCHAARPWARKTDKIELIYKVYVV